MLGKYKNILVVLILVFFLQNCDHGLKPTEENERTAISGTITYQNWPPADSLKDLRLVVFKQYPPADILMTVLSGQAIVFPPIGSTEGLPLNVESYDYTMDIPTGLYEYVAVAQQYGDSIETDWRAVGQYDTTGTGLDTIPTTLNVIENQILGNINITVDFHNLPYQPFGE